MPTLTQRLRQRLSRHPEGWGRGSSKGVHDREKDAGALLGSIATFKDDVATRLGEDLAPHLGDGETVPDQALLLELAGRRVRAALARLIEVDQAYGEAVLKHLLAQRERRQWARQELYPRVRDARREIEILLGYENGRKVHGLEGRTRRKIDPLRLQARTLIKELESQGSEALYPGTRGGTVDPRRWLRDVRPAYLRLKELGWQVELREQEASGAKEARDDEIETFDAAYGNALRYVRSAYELAGLGPRALRWIRSYQQRRRLERWAGFRREDRAAKKELAAEKAPARSRIVSLAGWLRRFGSR